MNTDIIFQFEHAGYAATVEVTEDGYVAGDEAGGHEPCGTQDEAIAAVAELMTNAADIAAENGDMAMSEAILAGRPA